CSSHLLSRQSNQQRGRISRAFEAFFDRAVAIYDSGLNWVFRHQFLTLMGTIALVILTGYLYVVIPKGFFPEQDTGFLFGQLEAREDSSFEAIARMENQVSQIIQQDPAVAGLVGFAGATGGNSSEATARWFIQLKVFGHRPPIQQVMARLRPKVAKVIGAKFFMQAGQDVTVGGRLEQAEYQYTLTDTDSNELNQWAPKILAKMQDMKILTDVASDQQIASPHIAIEIDRDAASRLGISLTTIDTTLYSAFGQQQISTIYLPAQQSKLILEVEPRFQTQPSDLSNIYLAGSNGQVPLSA